MLVHHGHRRLVAAAHTGRGHDTHVGAEQLRQARQQIARAGMAQLRLSHTRTVKAAACWPSSSRSK